MKSIQRPSKPLKQQPQATNPKRDETTIKTAETHPQDLPRELTQQGEAITKPTPKQKLKERSQSWQSQRLTPESDSEELPPSPCQHIQFLDCYSEVGRVIFECYHCKQGIISEYTGEPVMGEYKGRPSVILAKVKCPNCEQTAIRLQAREVISITAIPSPWA